MPATATHARDRKAPQHNGSVQPTYHGLPAHQRGQQIKANPFKWLRSLVGLSDRANDQQVCRAAAEEICRLRGEPTTLPERTDAMRLGSEAEAPLLRHGTPTKVPAKAHTKPATKKSVPAKKKKKVVKASTPIGFQSEK